MDWEELGINKSELDKYMKNTKEKEEDKDQPESGEQLDSDEVEKYEFKFYNFFRSKSHSKEEEVGGINGKAKPKLGQIEEHNEEEEQANEKNELQKMKALL